MPLRVREGLHGKTRQTLLPGTSEEVGRDLSMLPQSIGNVEHNALGVENCREGNTLREGLHWLRDAPDQKAA